ncbi:CLUMA_CG019189, isoform A [Clunio marinus]|uniref:CLUMA_CG019189, isoform A n=1 Tax=Clunio marinus TaxID=568069 RepID=A0A1J1J157_9DIPT|nr:CLUMA_CG019189, isoform A [Clunio marinus]
MQSLSFISCTDILRTFSCSKRQTVHNWSVKTRQLSEENSEENRIQNFGRLCDSKMDNIMKFDIGFGGFISIRKIHDGGKITAIAPRKIQTPTNEEERRNFDEHDESKWKKFLDAKRNFKMNEAIIKGNSNPELIKEFKHFLFLFSKQMNYLSTLNMTTNFQQYWRTLDLEPEEHDVDINLFQFETESLTAFQD